MDFLISAKAVSMPQLGVVGIIEEAEALPCRIPMARSEPAREKTISTLQLNEGVKRVEIACLAMFKSEEENVKEAFLPMINGIFEDLKGCHTQKVFQ